MEADDVAGPVRRRGDLVGIEIGGVGRQYRAGAAGRIELPKHRAFDVEVLENGFDHQVHAGQVGVVGRGAQSGKPLRRRLLRDAAALDGGGQSRLDRRQAAPQRLLIAFHQGDRQPGIEQRHRDAGAHGAAADHGGIADGARRNPGDLLDLRRRPLGKEDVAQRPRLVAVAQRQKDRALLSQRRFGVQGHRIAHGLQRAQRGDLRAPLATVASWRAQ